MKFLIVGAEFNNKGAQAMLFVTVSELMDRFPDCEILFMTKETPVEGYTFKFFYDNNGWNYSKGGSNLCKAMLRAFIKTLSGRKNQFKKIKEFTNELRSVDAFIDISGYALSSQRGTKRSKSYLDQIKVAKRFHVPYFIMPQSIGPFEYGRDQKYMETLLKKYLNYPVIILPREYEGYSLLTEKYGLHNVKQSHDLVLQNKNINTANIYIDASYMCAVPKLDDGEKVAVIPNMKNFDFSSKEYLINLYVQIINKLRLLNKKIYLIRHSGEDIEACRLIFDALKDRSNVFLIEDEFDCIQFNGVISQFDYVVGSRYHSIVHSYKNSIPAIVLGWAVKYHELVALFKQERFMFDVRDKPDINNLLETIDDMESSWKKEHVQISELLNNYQQDSCFNYITDYFNK